MLPEAFEILDIVFVLEYHDAFAVVLALFELPLEDVSST